MTIQIQGVSFEVHRESGINGTWDFWEDVNEGKWEPDTFEVLKRYLNPEKECIDVGAWIGPTALFSAQLSKSCIALEPDPTAFEWLEKNTELNRNIKTPVLRPIALSVNNSDIYLGNKDKKGNSESSILFANCNESWISKAITLNGLIESEKLNNINFIKMDIEGGEYYVLPSIKEFIQNTGVTLYLSLHYPFFDDKGSYISVLKDTLSEYKYIYTSYRLLLDINTIQDHIHNFCSIICTNEPW